MLVAQSCLTLCDTKDCNPPVSSVPPETKHRSPALQGDSTAAAKLLQLCPILCDPIDPTRLCPWDSPGKITGVGCHFLLQCMKVKSESEVTQSCLTLSDPIDSYQQMGVILLWLTKYFACFYLGKWLTDYTFFSPSKIETYECILLQRSSLNSPVNYINTLK